MTVTGRCPTPSPIASFDFRFDKLSVRSRFACRDGEGAGGGAIDNPYVFSDDLLHALPNFYKDISPEDHPLGDYSGMSHRLQPASVIALWPNTDAPTNFYFHAPPHANDNAHFDARRPNRSRRSSNV